MEPVFKLALPYLYSDCLICRGFERLLSCFLFSSLKVAPVLKGIIGNVNFSLGLRKGLVIVRFSISIILAIGLLIIHEQIEFMRDKDLGINEEMVLSIPIQTDDFIKNYYSIHEDLLQLEGVESVTRTGSHLARMGFDQRLFHVEDNGPATPL